MGHPVRVQEVREGLTPGVLAALVPPVTER